MDTCYSWVYSSLRESSLSQCCPQVTTVTFPTTVPKMSQQETTSQEGEIQTSMCYCD